MDRLIFAVAALQQQVIVWDQLIALGLARGAIEHRVKRGLLRPLHRGVYLCGQSAPGPRAQAMAAVLACGENAVLSHGAAAALWGILPAADGLVDVTIVGHRARHAGIRAHQTRRLHPLIGPSCTASRSPPRRGRC